MATDRLQAFCDTKWVSGDKFDLRVPWVANGWLYAADGRIAIREPTEEADTDDDRKRPKRIADMFENFPRCMNSWPHHDGAKKMPECATCGGSGTVPCVCEMCCHPHTRECPRCRGVLKPLVIARRLIAGTYCQAIEALGNVYYSKRGKPEEALSFCCGELQGKVMPLHPE